jgi:hypothetical protein
MNSVPSPLAGSRSLQPSTPVAAGRTTLLSSSKNNNADPAYCRAFVLLIFLAVVLAFFLVGGLFTLRWLESIGIL